MTISINASEDMPELTVPTGGFLRTLCAFVANHGIWVTVVLGCLGNGLCLIVFARRKHIKPNDVFIITLAVLDFCFCLLNGVYHQMTDDEDPSAHQELHCALQNSLYHFLIASTALTLLAITVDRYFAVFHVLEHRAFVTNRKCLFCVMVTMGVCFVLVSPISFGCYLQVFFLLTYMYFVSFFLIVVDAFVIVYVYARIYIVIRQYDCLRKHMVNAEMALDVKVQNTSRPEEVSGQRSSDSKKSSNAAGNLAAEGTSRVPYGCMRLTTCQTSLKSGNDASRKISAVNLTNNVNCQENNNKTPLKNVHINVNYELIQVVDPKKPEPVCRNGRERKNYFGNRGQCQGQGQGQGHCQGQGQGQGQERDEKVIQIKKNIKRETKTTRVCILVSSIFIVCCLPSAAIQVVWQLVNEDFFSPTSMFFPLLKMFYTLSTFNAIANPIIYSISSSRFQQDIKRIFTDVTENFSKCLRRLPCLH